MEAQDSQTCSYDLLLQDKSKEVCDQLDVAQTRRRRPPLANPDQIRDRMPPALTGFDVEIDDTPISSSGRVRVAKVRKVRHGQKLPF
jgi:hypothetical protein